MPIAEAELGVTEIGGSSHNARIVEYHQATSLGATSDETSWCSSFANWAMKSAGMTGTNMANARSWLNWGQPVDTPQYGTVVVFWRESQNSWKGHVGFFDSMSGNYLRILGGNQGSPGSVKYSNYGTSQLLGYRQPDI